MKGSVKWRTMESVYVFIVPEKFLSLPIGWTYYPFWNELFLLSVASLDLDNASHRSILTQVFTQKCTSKFMIKLSEIWKWFQWSKVGLISFFLQGEGGLETKKCSKICRLEHFDSLKETSLEGLNYGGRENLCCLSTIWGA